MKIESSANRQKIHPTCVPGATYDNSELGRQIGELRFDQLSLVLSGLSAELERQSRSDFKRGRIQLADLLSKAEKSLGELREIVEKMFRLSKPHMEHELLIESADKQDGD